MAKVKGVALQSRMSMILEHFGKEAYDTILSELSEDTRVLLTGNLLSSSWYPAEVFKELNQTTNKVMKYKVPNSMEILGELTAQLGLTTIHKVKVKESPAETLKRVPMLWSAFHDSGEITLISDPGRPNKFTMKLEGYALPHKEFCRNLMGWANKLIELSGGYDVKTEETMCVCDGAPHCEIVVTWK